MAKEMQAPALEAIGEKDRNFGVYKGFASRTQTLEYGMMNVLDTRDFVAFKLMLFLTGNMPNVGFRVPEKTVLDWCHISSTSYYDARNKLERMGWLEVSNGEYIRVLYDNIYRDIEKKTTGKDSKLQTTSEDFGRKTTSKDKKLPKIERELKQPTTGEELTLQTTGEGVRASSLHLYYNNISGDNKINKKDNAAPVSPMKAKATFKADDGKEFVF